MGFVEYEQSPNEFRTGIYFIKYKHDKYKPDESLIIPKDEEIRIVFNSSLTNTTKFFYDYLDQNVEHIILIDLSHFNSSILESADRMFSGCTSLEYIDMSNFNAPLIKNMSNMFFHCDSLKGIDLSKLNSSALTDINKMFCGCASLEYLILDGLDFSKVKDASYLFYNVKNLKLINIYDIKYNDIFMDEINELNKLENENIFVSQKEKLLTNPNYKYNTSNIENDESECHSYIIVYYKEAIEYESGFIIEGINSRNNILFIINEGNINGTNEKLTISENFSLKLCLKNSVKSLESFFDASKDTKTEKILSIDFSHFDSSSVNYIDNIFSGCQNLLAVDMSNFNLENIKSSEDTFKGTENLKYINFYNIANYIANLSNIDLNGIKELNLIIFQSEKILEFDNFKNIFCEFNLELEMCHSNNYITVKYNERSVYDNGYKNDVSKFLEPERSGVNYIIKGNSLFLGDEPFTIEVNESIEIHFYPNITSLNSFFGDHNEESVISIDLSHFDSSSLKDMGYMFSFTSIEEIDFTNFDSSMVTNMDSTFYFCSNLKSLDLSSFKGTNVKNMDDVFTACSNLEYIDLSNFDFGNLNYFGFYLETLKYINLYNSKNYEFMNYFYAQNKFILNQKTNIVDHPKPILNNCDTTKIPFKCESDNYITVKFKDKVNYASFFINSNITSRNGISYITYGDSIIGNIKEQDYSYGGEEGDEDSGKNDAQLIIEANDSLEIYFSEPISNLENFFNGEFDNNAKSIFYVDLSHFNSSLVNNTNKMFYNCPNL